MKKRASFLTVLAVLTFAACTQTDNTSSAQTVNSNVSNANKTAVTNSTPANTETKQLTENECKICDFDFANYKGELKKEEIEGLLLALNDEYLAAAIYGQVNKDFNDPRPFVNIVEAEKRHAERLKAVFSVYKIPVPENPWTGNVTKFNSLAEACKAGVEGEIVNRQLYDKLFKSTAREDILIVYRAVQRASEENHLPAFERCGAGGGGGRGRRQGGGMNRGNF
jgi:hypothetical protein